MLLVLKLYVIVMQTVATCYYFGTSVHKITITGDKYKFAQ